jgi:multiple sugar transport system ATP-binding protein
MGRAIVRDPAVFLFDEPLSNLDAQLRVQMRSEIKALHQRLKTTVVYVTHDQVEAMTMADRIVVLNDGNVEQVGAPLELFDRPANLFVAGFIGSPSMNMLDGRIESIGGVASFVSGDFSLSLGAAASAKPGEAVVLGFRPEHLALAGPGTPGNLEAEVVVVEPTGTETLLYITAAGHTLLALFRARLEVTPGDKVMLSIDPAHVHLFDKTTGKRL